MAPKVVWIDQKLGGKNVRGVVAIGRVLAKEKGGGGAFGYAFFGQVIYGRAYR